MNDTEAPIPDDDPVKLDRPPYLLRPRFSGETLRFETMGDLEEWIAEELDAWSSVFAIEGPPNHLRKVGQYVGTRLDRLKDFVRQYQDGERNDNVLGQIQNGLQDIQDGGVPISEAPWVSTALRLVETDPEAAFAMLVLAMSKQKFDAGGDFNNEPQAFLRGLVNGLKVYLAESHVAQEQTLRRLRGRWDDRFRQLHKREDKTRTDLEREISRQHRIETAALSVFTKIRDEWTTAYEKAFSEHHEHMADMEQAFSTKMQLQASELFWKDKETMNRNRAETAQRRFYTVAAVGLAGYLIFCGIVSLIFGKELMVFSPISTAMFIVPLGLLIWVLRFYSQEHKTNVALADDANERHNMVLAFKALEYDGHIPPEERLVVLQALFRPHGRPPEDTVPVPVWDTILQRIDPGLGKQS